MERDLFGQEFDPDIHWKILDVKKVPIYNHQGKFLRHEAIYIKTQPNNWVEPIETKGLPW